MLTSFRTAALVCALVVLSSNAAHAETHLRVPLRVEPPQAVRAVALKAGGQVFACEVRDGVLLVPSTVPLPWTVSQLRFEETSYTQADFERKAPLVLRELGELRIRLQPTTPETVRGFFLRSGESNATDASMQRGEDGALRTSLAAGVYAAAFVSESRATRIRSGVVIAPGQPTEIGDLAFEPTGSVSLRVVDGRTKRPVRGARVTWSPAEALNASVARQLFSSVWSGTTDRGGTITFRSIGPPPLAAMWNVEASQYAPARTARVLIADTRRVAAPDVALRAESALMADVALPRKADDFDGASLILSEPESEDSPRFEPVLRQPLREGENKLKLTRFGRMRLSIEAKGGRKLFFQDVEVGPDDRRVSLAPLPVEIHGVAKRSDKPVEGVRVTVADRHDARMIVGRALTGEAGSYSLATYQTGRVLVYTSERFEDGTIGEGVMKTLELTGESEIRLDFNLPSASATLMVTDAETAAPLRAQVRGTYTTKRGVSTGVYVDTDDRGIGRIAGAYEGTAKVFVRSQGYRDREVTFDIRPDAPEVRIALAKAGVTAGRVVDDRGVPVAGARVLGGFLFPVAAQGRFEATTDVSGGFVIKGGPEPGTPFYVVARGQALTVAYLRESEDNVVRLSRPNAGAVTVLAGHAPPKRLPMLLPGPRGGGPIPYGAIHQLAELNGLSDFQLLGTGTDGTFVLPEFLAPGEYALYNVLPTGKLGAEKLDKVADLKVPARPGAIITIPEQ